MSNKKRQQPSGAAKMKKAGKLPVMLGVLPDDLDKIRKAANMELRPVSQFVLFHALRAAEKLLSKS